MTDTRVADHAPGDQAGVPYARFTRRLNAAILDGLLYVGLIVVMVIAAPLFENTVLGQRLFFGAIVLSFVLYEPVFVATRGGTLGHGWTNLRVAANGSGARLGFLRALLRFLVKAFLGWSSFATMAFTRRHQAVHDLVTGSHVLVRDLGIATPEHYVAERAPVPVGVLRRLVVITIYIVIGLLLVGVATATMGIVSETCLDTDTCTPAEEGVLAAVGMTWLILAVVTIALGWLGRLPGARNPPSPAPPPQLPARSELLDAGILFARRHSFVVLRATLPAVVPAVIVDLTIDLVASGPDAQLLWMPVSLVMWGLAEGMAIAACWDLLHGHAPTAARAWALVSRRPIAVGVGYCMKWLLIMGGVFLLIVPGMYVLGRWFAVPTATIVEQVSLRDGVRRSRELTRLDLGRVLWTVGAVELGLMVLAVVVSALLPGESLEWSSPVQTVAWWILGVVCLPFRAGLTALVYLDIRVRREGYDLQVALSGLGNA